MLNVKKCMCWYSSIIELKNARWNIEIRKWRRVVYQGTNLLEVHETIMHIGCFQLHTIHCLQLETTIYFINVQQWESSILRLSYDGTCWIGLQSGTEPDFLENVIPIYQIARRHVSGTHLSVNDHSISPKNMHLIYFLCMMRYYKYVTLYNIRLRKVH